MFLFYKQYFVELADVFILILVWYFNLALLPFNTLSNVVVVNDLISAMPSAKQVAGST